MALFKSPAPDLIVKPANNDQLVAHRRAALYSGSDPVKMYNSACYYQQHVLGIDIAPFHKYWILNYCFMAKGEELEEEFLKIASKLFEDISLSDQELAYRPMRRGVEVISFRGSIKSTVFQAVASWELQRKGIDIAVGSYSAGQIAKEWIPNFRIMIEISKDNLELDWEYKTDNEDRKVITWDIPSEDPEKPLKITSRMMGVGHRGAIRMIHPDLWIIDDWLDKKMESTLEEAERVFKQEVFGTRSPHTPFVVVGTILAEGDMLYKIKSGEIGGKFFNYTGTYPGYLNEEKKIPRWDKRGAEFMDEQRDVQGELIFQIEYMLNPISDKSALVATKYLDKAKEAGMDLCLGRLAHPDALTVSGNDFQYSDSSDADWGVNFGLEFFTNPEIKPKIRILAMERYRGKDDVEILRMIEDDNKKYHHAQVGFEKNNFQKILADIYKRNNALFPVYEHNTGSERNQFQVGIPSLRQIFTNYDIAIPWDCEDCREEMSVFCKELQGWQYSKEHKKYIHKGRYKDTTLAFWIAILTLRMAEYGTIKVMAID